MRTFSIPFIIKQEEKIFGGYISIRQFIYMLLAVLSGLIFYSKLHVYVKVSVFLIILTLMLLFAFLKISGIYFDKYTLIVVNYLLRRKLYL